MTLRMKSIRKNYLGIIYVCFIIGASMYIGISMHNTSVKWGESTLVRDCRDLLNNNNKEIEDSLKAKCQQIVDKHNAEYDIRKKKERLEFIERLRNEVR